MIDNQMYPPASPAVQESTSEWPFLATRTVHWVIGGKVSDSGWRFVVDRAPSYVNDRPCDGIAPPDRVKESHSILWGHNGTHVVRVSVHGAILPGRVVRLASVSLFSLDNVPESEGIAADPFRGLLEFLKGETFEESEYQLWETIQTTATMAKWSNTVLSSYPREESCRTSLSPEPGPGS